MSCIRSQLAFYVLICEFFEQSKVTLKVMPDPCPSVSNLIFFWVRAGSNIKYEGDGQWYGHHVRL